MRRGPQLTSLSPGLLCTVSAGMNEREGFDKVGGDREGRGVLETVVSARQGSEGCKHGGALVLRARPAHRDPAMLAVGLSP